MTQQKGLTTKEANRLLVKHGENTIQSGKKIRPLRIFAAQFKDLLTLILLGSTILSVLMGEIVEAATIIIIVFLNAVMGFFQEFRTEKSLEKLSQMASPTATVLRDGKISTIPTQYLVPGDYIFLKAGDHIPADCRLIEHNALHCSYRGIPAGGKNGLVQRQPPFPPVHCVHGGVRNLRQRQGCGDCHRPEHGNGQDCRYAGRH